MTNLIDVEEIKMILLGEAGAGKTSIISRYALNKFDSNYFTTYSSTFLTKLFEYKGKKYNINIWDTVGQEKFRSLTKIFIKGTKICLLVYDITNKHSFDELTYWLEQAKQISDNDVILGMAGNKNDLIMRQQVDDKIAINFANENNIIFGTTSAAKNKSSVDQLLDKLIIKYLESKNPSFQSNDQEENKIKLNTINNKEEKKDMCSFLEFTKNLFKFKKKDVKNDIKREETKKNEEKKMWSLIPKSDNKNISGNIKICILGGRKVGKTYFCKTLFEEKYIDSNQIESNDNKKYNKILNYNNKYFTSEINDFNDKGNINEIKNSDIIICLYTLNDENSYNELLNYWYPFIKNNNENKNAIIGIAENKNDLKSENGIQFDVDILKSNDDIKKALNVNNDIIFEKISCKTNLNINKLFQRIIDKFIEIKQIK